MVFIEIIRNKYKIEIIYFGPIISNLKRFGVQKAKFYCQLYLQVYKNISNESNHLLYSTSEDIIEEEMDEPEMNPSLCLYKKKRIIIVEYTNNDLEELSLDNLLKKKESFEESEDNLYTTEFFGTSYDIDNEEEMNNKNYEIIESKDIILRDKLLEKEIIRQYLKHEYIDDILQDSFFGSLSQHLLEMI